MTRTSDGDDTRPHRTLWLTVLAFALREKDGERWIATRDFFTVCQLCELDPIAVRERFRAHGAAPASRSNKRYTQPGRNAA